MLWQNTLNTRKQAYWNHYHVKRMYETYEELLLSNPPKMPQEFLPIYIEGEPEIRKQLAIEKFKNNTLQQCHAQRYQQRFQSLDSKMVHILQQNSKKKSLKGSQENGKLTAKSRKKFLWRFSKIKKKIRLQKRL